MKEVVMPKLALTMTKGTIVKWMKSEGENVEKGEPLFEVETDKIVNEIEAPASGTLLKIAAPVGKTVPVFQAVGFIGAVGETLAEISLQETSFEPSMGKTGRVEERVLISPVARKIAIQHRLDISRIRGTGPGGRIVKENVVRAVEEVQKTAEEFANIIPLTQMRKSIVDNLSRSHLTSVHVTITSEIDATEMMNLRQRLDESGRAEGVDITYTDILIKAVSAALKDYPSINSTLEGDNVKLFKNINIGLAVALEDGLVVPVIRNADEKSIVDLSRSVRDLAARSRDNRLSPDELTGGTFTITNLGMFGVDFFTPIITPSQSAILGVGRIRKKPVTIDDEIVSRPMVSLSLSFDHRVVDGALAARFMLTLAQLLEKPQNSL